MQSIYGRGDQAYNLTFNRKGLFPGAEKARGRGGGGPWAKKKNNNHPMEMSSLGD